MRNVIKTSTVESFINECYPTNPFLRDVTKDLYTRIKNKFLPKWELTKVSLVDNQVAINEKNQNFTLDVGSFTAGGFARWIFFAAKKVKSIDWQEHLFNGRPPKSLEDLDLKTISQHLVSMYLARMVGDIDIYFRSTQDNMILKGKIESALQTPVHHGSYKITKHKETKFASTFCYDLNAYKEALCDCGGNRFFIQFINNFFGDPQRVLNTFDIKNARIAIDFRTDTVWYDDEVIELETNNCLGLTDHCTTQPYIVHRVAKYVTKHGYTKMEKESLKTFVKWCHKNLKDEKSHPGLDDMEKVKQRAKLATLMRSPIFNVQDLPLLMGLSTIRVGIPPTDGAMPTDQYDYVSYVEVDAAVDAMKKRMSE